MGKYLESQKNSEEIFLWNTNASTPIKEWEKQFKTLGRGTVALDIHGKELPSHYVPVFIHKSQYMAYDRALMREFEQIKKLKK